MNHVLHPSRIVFCFAAVLFSRVLIPWASGDSAVDGSVAAPALTDSEKAGGWKLLFDGVTTTGWRGLGMAEFPSVWVVQDGCLRCMGGYKGANDLVTVDEYENFELSFEWLIPKVKGNSGVKYRVQEQEGKGYAFGPEYQCMNDPEAFDIHASGALYDVFAPQGKKLVPPPGFNQSRIVVSGNHVEHWLNGIKVIEAEFGSEAMNQALTVSHFKKSDWGKNPRGHIILQDHHSEVFFRNIKVRVLPPPAGAQ